VGIEAGGVHDLSGLWRSEICWVGRPPRLWLSHSRCDQLQRVLACHDRQHEWEGDHDIVGTHGLMHQCRVGMLLVKVM
jgi:hypothetical protein